MLESVIQSKVIKLLNKSDWFVLKIIQSNKNGIADLYCYKNGRTVWIETKRLDKLLRPLQSYRKKEVISYGMECYRVDSIESFMLLNLI